MITQITRRAQVPKLLKELIPHYDENRLFINFGPKLYHEATYTIIVNNKRVMFNVRNDVEQIKAFASQLEEYFVTGRFDMHMYYMPSIRKRTDKYPYYISKPVDGEEFVKVPLVETKSKHLIPDSAALGEALKELRIKDPDICLTHVGKLMQDYQTDTFMLKGVIKDPEGHTFSDTDKELIKHRFINWLDKEMNLIFEEQ